MKKEIANDPRSSISSVHSQQRRSTESWALQDSFIFYCLEQQGPLFTRPSLCLVAALVEANKPEDEANAIIDAIKKLLKDIGVFQNQCVYEDSEVKRIGREWLRSIGRRVRKLLSLCMCKRAITTESVFF
ncbi:unnamed protein product [Penicillium salamii]|uniref:Uncharacterized protein n=1 Tax=Penicillium salamii TaxID=1612424 RepID=A0A9W4JU39_9EURO|nr:unnamed protein product [Penicillium salamii]CAG8347019.1 unnamed protein product [Penicillium salamii]CAG8368168.1 unnamed protein product [Penicillium salamii]CAG8376982.1 unnamed protein product [Penicillium salamii]CAG8379151.1 unnamed protein product [Penicillium salamii]